MSTVQKLQQVSKRPPKNEWSAIVDALDRLMKTRTSGEDCLESKRKGKGGFNKRTLAMLNLAYATTLRYYVDLLGGGSRNLKTEAVISGLWRQTGRLIRHFDPALASSLTACHGFWSQDSTWSLATIQKAWVSLNSIRVSANLMDPDKSTLQRWSMLASE